MKHLPGQIRDPLSHSDRQHEFSQPAHLIESTPSQCCMSFSVSATTYRRIFLFFWPSSTDGLTFWTSFCHRPHHILANVQECSRSDGIILQNGISHRNPSPSIFHTRRNNSFSWIASNHRWHPSLVCDLYVDRRYRELIILWLKSVGYTLLPRPSMKEVQGPPLPLCTLAMNSEQFLSHF